jgi:uncharacterized protein
VCVAFAEACGIGDIVSKKVGGEGKRIGSWQLLEETLREAL